MVHVQAAHMINIYELGADATNNNHTSNNNNNNLNNKNNNNNTAIVDDSHTTTNKLNGNLGDKIEIDAITECVELDNSANPQIFTAAINVSPCETYMIRRPPSICISFVGIEKYCKRH